MRLVPTPVGPANVFPDASPFTRKPAASLVAEVASILRRPGVEAHVFMPGIGWQDGISFINSIMEDGTQALTVDQPWGYAGDPVSSVGPELCLDPAFDDPARWTTNTGWSVTGSKLVATSVVNGVSTYQTGALSGANGKTYEITFTISNRTGGQVRVGLEGVYGQSYAVNGTVTQYITAATSTPRIFIQATANGTSLEVDNISVRELVGAIPARQTTTANKPILRRGWVNRFLFSQDQSNANWGKSNSSVASGAAAPDGTSTAFVMSEDTATSTHDLTQARSITAALPHTVSIYLKANGRTLVRVMMTWNGVTDRVHADFNLSNGTVGAAVITGTGVSTASPTIASVGDGWYRCTISGSCATGATLTAYVRAMQSAGVVSYTGSGAAAYNVWGAQLETGSTANTYVPTTTAAASASTGPFWAEFDGTDFMTLAAVPFGLNDDFAVVFGSAINSNAANSRVFASTGTTAVFRINWDNATSKYTSVFTNDAGASTAIASPAPTIALGQVAVTSVRQSGTSKQIRTNGVAGVASTAAVGIGTLSTRSDIGAQGGAVQWNGAIYPVIAIKGTITDAELSTIERWVAQQSGITL